MVLVEELRGFVHAEKQFGLRVVHLDLNQVVAGQVDEEEGEVYFLLPLVHFALVAIPLQDLLDRVLL